MAADREQKYVLTAYDQTKAAFDSLAKSLTTTQGLMAKIGVTLSVGAFAAFVKHAIDAADEMGKLSQKVGISVEALSALKFASELSNVSMESLTAGLGKLSNTMLAAATGGREQSSVLQALGVDLNALRGGTLTLDQAFAQIAQRTAGMRDGWQKTSLLQAALGKGAKDLVPLLNENADGFRAVTEEARKYGAIITEQLADKAQEFNDNLTRMHALLRGIALTIASDVLPALNETSKAFLDLSSNKDSTTGFWSSIGELIRLAAVAAGSFWLALKDMGDGIGALMAQTAALAHFDLDAITAIGKERDEQHEKNKKQFEEFQAQLLAHSKVFGDGETPATPSRKKGGGLFDLEDLTIEKSGLRKFLDDVERETEKLNNKFDPITKEIQDKWLRVFQIAREGNLSIEAAGQQAAPFIDAYKDALIAAREETRLLADETQRAQDRLSDWESSKQIIEGLRDSTKFLQETTLTIGIGGTPAETAKWIELSRQNMDIERQSIALTGEARDVFIEAAKKQQFAWAEAFNENYRVTRSFATGFKSTMSEIYEDATNSAAQTHDLFVNAFRGMEDALVAFVKTGKLNFHDLADSIVSDLIRIQIQRAILGPLAGALGGFFGSFGGPSAAPGTGASSYGPTAGTLQIEAPARAGGGDAAANQPYWVGENGPELFVPHSSGTVVANGKAGGSTYYIDARGADQAGLARLEGMIRQINGSIEPRAVGAVAQARQRGTTGLR